MRLWAKSNEVPEGKFLVVRRDGTVPAWPHFVLGARDPAAPFALRAYAAAAAALGMDPAFTADINTIAEEWENYRELSGDGDPDAAPHRTDDPNVIKAMRGYKATIVTCPSRDEKKRTVKDALVEATDIIGRRPVEGELGYVPNDSSK